MRNSAITKNEQTFRMSGVGIKIALITFVLGQVILIIAPCPVSAQQSYEAYYNYLENYPEDKSTEWSESVNGVTHDDYNWFISQEKNIWKIPVTHNLSSVSNDDEGVIEKELDDSDYSKLKGDGYDHFGDLEWYEFEDQGYLFVPAEGKDNPEVGAIAIFNADNLQYMHHDYLMDGENILQSRAAWCAVDRQGFVYSSGRDVGFINKYRIEWNLLKKKVRPWLEKVASISLLSEEGSQVYITYVQGGVISPSGLLYLVAGYSEQKDSKSTWGIHVFNLSTGRRVQRSTNGYGYFNYAFDPGRIGLSGDWDFQEPEGITIWDLDDGRAPEIRGQLHVFVLDNELNTDHIYFKHYTGIIYVDYSYSGDEQRGRPSEPFKTVSEANTVAWDGAHIVISAGSYPEKLTFSKRIRVVAENGAVIIGQ
jgi:hypothetical protein